MSLIKKSITVLLIAYYSVTLASPPFQILRTCVDDTPYNNEVTLSMIEGRAPVNKSFPDCHNQYEFVFQDHTYGTMNCENKFYIIINGKKIAPELADNFSINPEIKPGTPFTPRALWYKIDYQEKSYLCILSPLSEQGVGSSFNQYYIVENAFDVNLNPELYFYFLDENIAPITSKNL